MYILLKCLSASPVVQVLEEPNPEGELNSWDGWAEISLVFFQTSNQCWLSEVCDSKGNQASSAGQHKTNLSWRQKADIFQCVWLDGWSGVAFTSYSCDHCPRKQEGHQQYCEAD